MASIDKRSNGRYRARWREYPGGPQKTRQFTRKADADRFLDGIRGELARGLYIDPDGSRVRFRDYAEQWRAAQIHRPSTATQAETYLRVHAYPFLGNRELGTVRRSEIQAWVRKRSEVLAPSSVEVVYRWVATVFKSAVADRLIPSSPCVNIKLPKKDDAELVPLSVEEVERLADAMPERYRALIVFDAGMGLRQGECFGLTIDRVDFLRRQVRVDRQLSSVRDGIPTFGPPKSQAGFRTVPVPAVVADALSAHLARFATGPAGLVFTNKFGRPLQRSAFGTAWHRAAREAEIPKWATFHDLRHFYASLLISRGCSVKAVQRRLGHQSAMETLDTYSHLWPDSDDETRDAVDQVLGRVRAAS
jgi:integrase